MSSNYAIQIYDAVMIEEMFMSGAVEMNRNAKADVLIIGLGGGFMNSHLHATYPMMNLTGVELEEKMVEIAIKWYGLVLDSRQRVYTMDGIKFIQLALKEGWKYDVVFVDACFTDINREINCPIDQFLQNEHITSLSKLITKKGAVIVDVLSLKMDEKQMADMIKGVYEKVFRNCVIRSSPSDNTVLSCTQHDRPENLKMRYEEFVKSIEKGID
ncbi:hypothetical protein GCK32_007203 [Trichostrongylus colubriformis]|uniref:Uncharacterized protein n=1 Tax=Trichostrongylus colubriformis TaxID=6319 RepID=A0AAN8FUM3_TRICO